MTNKNIKAIVGDEEQFLEDLAQAVERVLDTQDEKAVQQWIDQHADEIGYEVQSFITEAVRRVHTPKPVVTAPVLRFEHPESRQVTEVYVGDSGQRVHIADHRSQKFGGDDTASLVYVEKGHGLSSTEYNIAEPSIWAWIQEWMQKGMNAERTAKQPTSQAV